MCPQAVCAVPSRQLVPSELQQPLHSCGSQTQLVPTQVSPAPQPPAQVLVEASTATRWSTLRVGACPAAQPARSRPKSSKPVRRAITPPDQS
jgi:hypothetical protein